MRINTYYNQFSSQNMLFFDQHTVFYKRKEGSTWEEEKRDERGMGMAESVISEFEEYYRPNNLEVEGDHPDEIIHGVRDRMMQGPLGARNILSGGSILEGRVYDSLQEKVQNAPRLYRQMINEEIRRGAPSLEISREMFSYDIENGGSYMDILTNLQAEIMGLGYIGPATFVDSQHPPQRINLANPNQINVFDRATGAPGASGNVAITIRWHQEDLTTIRSKLEQAGIWNDFSRQENAREFIHFKFRQTLIERTLWKEKTKLSKNKFDSQRLKYWLEDDLHQRALADADYQTWYNTWPGRTAPNVAALTTAQRNELARQQREARERQYDSSLEAKLKKILTPGQLENMSESLETRTMLAYLFHKMHNNEDRENVENLIDEMAGVDYDGNIKTLDSIISKAGEFENSIQQKIIDRDEKQKESNQLQDNVNRQQQIINNANAQLDGQGNVSRLRDRLNDIRSQIQNGVDIKKLQTTSNDLKKEISMLEKTNSNAHSKISSLVKKREAAKQAGKEEKQLQVEIDYKKSLITNANAQLDGQGNVSGLRDRLNDIRSQIQNGVDIKKLQTTSNDLKKEIRMLEKTISNTHSKISSLVKKREAAATQEEKDQLQVEIDYQKSIITKANEQLDGQGNVSGLRDRLNDIRSQIQNGVDIKKLQTISNDLKKEISMLEKTISNTNSEINSLVKKREAAKQAGKEEKYQLQVEIDYQKSIIAKTSAQLNGQGNVSGLRDRLNDIRSQIQNGVDIKKLQTISNDLAKEISMLEKNISNANSEISSNKKEKNKIDKELSAMNREIINTVIDFGDTIRQQQSNDSLWGNSLNTSLGGDWGEFENIILNSSNNKPGFGDTNGEKTFVDSFKTYLQTQMGTLNSLVSIAKNRKTYFEGRKTSQPKLEKMDSRGLLYKLIKRDIKLKGATADPLVEEESLITTNILIAQARNQEIFGNVNQSIARRIEQGDWVNADEWIASSFFFLPIMTASEAIEHTCDTDSDLNRLNGLSINSTPADMIRIMQENRMVSAVKLRELQKKLSELLRGVEVEGKRIRIRDDETSLVEKFINNLVIVESRLNAEERIQDVAEGFYDTSKNREQQILSMLQQQTYDSVDADRRIAEDLESHDARFKRFFLKSELKKEYNEVMEQYEGLPDEEVEEELRRRGLAARVRSRGIFSLRAGNFLKKAGKGLFKYNPVSLLGYGLYRGGRWFGGYAKEIIWTDISKERSKKVGQQAKGFFIEPVTTGFVAWPLALGSYVISRPKTWMRKISDWAFKKSN